MSIELVFCKSCGVVLNKQVLTFPEIWDDEDGSIIPGTAVWDGYLERFVAVTPCPVCKEPIQEEEW